VDNLKSIIQCGGCLSNNEKQRLRIDHLNIAYNHIQERRASKLVPCGPGGSLHDYAPFFFAPRPPMLYTISRGNVECYKGGQESLIYLVTTAQLVSESGCGWVFADGHGTMAFTGFYDNLAQLDQVDWDVMESHYWNDTNADPDRKRRRQAEFLVKDRCPWELISEIGVQNRNIKKRVQEILENAAHHPVISIHTEWYY
jgi:hypothetical protein